MFLVQHILFNTFNSKVYSRPKHGTHSVRESVIKQILQTIYNYNLYAVVHINLLFHHFCHIFIIINCSSRLIQCLRILDVNRKVEDRRGAAGGRERKEGGRAWSEGEYGVGERGSVGGWDGCRKITVGQGGRKRK